MKASVSPVATLIALAIAVSAVAQDALVLKDGSRREGQILGVRSDAVRLKVGPAETGIPLASVASVSMEAPKAFQQALDAWSKRNAAATISAIKPVVDNFLGLPTTWAARSAALLGEAYLAADNLPEAESAFAAFQKAYPDAAEMAQVGLARLAISKQDFSSAREKLGPIVEMARGTKLAESGQNATFGQALFLMGQVQEASGQKSEALENYLLAASLFREDAAAASGAAEKAKALEAENVRVP